MHSYLILVAGGRGLRMGAPVPKQFLSLAGKPVIFHTLNKFISYKPGIEIIIALPESIESKWGQLCEQYGFDHHHLVVKGGAERFHSVKNGLSMIRQKSLVAVHDAVRPLVSTETLDRCFAMAAQKGTAIPFIQPSESVRELAGRSSRPIKRDNIALIQTPQVFRSEIILAAYTKAYKPDFTDDASVVEAAGHKINLVKGNRENIKITTKEDLLVAEAMMKDER
ncbi:MAG: 2-C-methyl-D-erythritol 4-phosphate cytidylyltransferase [Bacteroidales bacterium]|nr:2-C-methyl-D-erythritol 4-phosphate cytidylyltransferase [Bacteroidales bacterium]